MVSMKVLTAKDVSDILRLGKNQTYTLMGSKAFPSFKIGKKLFVTDEALNEWLRKIQGKTVVV